MYHFVNIFPVNILFKHKVTNYNIDYQIMPDHCLYANIEATFVKISVHKQSFNWLN